MLLTGNAHVHGDLQQAPACARQQQFRLLDADALQMLVHGLGGMLPEQPVQIGGLDMQLAGDDGGGQRLGVVPAHDSQCLGHIAVGSSRLRLVLFQQPGHLQHDLDAYKEGLAEGSSLLDCLWGELYGSINIAEINDGAITHEHANYLRQKFLWGE